ncbi:adenylosuccinate lyase [bacterium]|nr:adenylosuccinate lyase [bacterium]
MIERYSREEIAHFWTEEYKIQKWLEIELAVLEKQEDLGLLPKKIFKNIKETAEADIKKIVQREKITHHDVAAFVDVLQASVGENGKFIHMGLTSSDIVDTANAIIIQEVTDVLREDIEKLQKILYGLADKYKYVPTIGRTHGIHAEPTTLGLKFAGFYSEFNRDLKRLEDAAENMRYGKISGPVGNYSLIDFEVEKYVCERFGLKPEPVSTQIVPRDRYAEYIVALAFIGAAVERVATEIRSLQQTEIREFEEKFASGQKGSSAMPHKKNPIQSEQLCGLARMLRSYITPAFENINLWHERDISHSSVERIILPDATILTDYMLVKLADTLQNLTINTERMKENIWLTKGLVFSQRFLIALMKAGLPRDKAYSMIQGKALKCWNEGLDFKALIVEDGEIRRYLTLEEIEAVFDLDIYMRNVDKIYMRVFGNRTE